MSHYNMGNYLLGLGEPKNAAASYRTALNLNPQAIMAMVNASIAHARMGENKKAEQSLQKALLLAPDNAAANLNMGLLKAEKNDLKATEKHFRAAFAADPRMAQAAYNICIITARNNLDEAVTWCRKASELAPREPKYAYTLAFYLNRKGDRNEAVRILQGLVEAYPQYQDAARLLKEISM
jgi:tetratricopeptide (TPR) repeat protein